MDQYIPVIGLEIHVELKTKSKMFCQCSADYFGKPPNSNTCPVCLGMPGALPVPNEKAIEWTIKIGKALGCHINLVSKFDRKHYFYPDLPKGYQISQYDEPIAVKGKLKTGNKEFRIHRVHLEEDTGKLIHSGGETLVDFNRSSVPLVEIVTEPDFDNGEDVKKFLEELHAIIETLNVSDADMEKGSMRLEPNISVRKVLKSEGLKGKKIELPNYKVEVKNINSFNFVKKAIEYEVKRHIELLEEGKTPPQETRGYVEKTGSTVSQRSKEEAQDYRYFPEPDIPSLVFEQQFIDSVKLPELPQVKQERYESDYQIKSNDSFLLARDKKMYVLFDEVMKDVKMKQKGQQVANMIINKKVPLDVSVTEFIKRVDELSAPKKTDMKALTSVIKKVVGANQKVVIDYKSGKQNAVMFLVGQVMKEMKGQADANVVREALIKHITNNT